ncbi:hypothetical protein HID58_046746 [Brassica napus]|uniref:Uncharacterized protein n=1 Tax=Brassica napus TaxID=3708 RepID=A0ABQ8AXF8_BRANA|nr:hypothetical protein HID58_046746 [Brassica napus]
MYMNLPRVPPPMPPGATGPASMPPGATGPASNHAASSSRSNSYPHMTLNAMLNSPARLAQPHLHPDKINGALWFGIDPSYYMGPWKSWRKVPDERRELWWKTFVNAKGKRGNIFSAWLFLLWLNSLITSDTAARRFQVSSPAASFTRKTHRSSPVTMEMVRSVNAAPPITTAGSAQSECKLTGSTRLSTATNHPLPWFSISHPLHCLTTAPSPTSLCSSAAVSELDPNRSLDVSFHCVVMDLRPSSGLDESYGSRYGNIGVLFLSWISVYAPLWIIVKRIVSPLRRLYYTPDIAAAPSHQGFYGAKLHWLNLCLQVTAGPIVQECCFARVAHDYVTAASLSHYAVSSINGSSQSRSSFPNLLVAGTIVGLRTVNVAYGSRASHLKFLPLNIPAAYRCINVVFDYQLFFQTIAMGTKVEFSFGFLHFAEHDSPFDGSIFSCFVLFSNFILPSSAFPGSSGSVDFASTRDAINQLLQMLCPPQAPTEQTSAQPQAPTPQP